jgi:hypothetical protein
MPLNAQSEQASAAATLEIPAAKQAAEKVELRPQRLKARSITQHFTLCLKA